MPFTTGDRAKLEQKIQNMIDDFPVDAASFLACCDMLIDMATVAADACRDDEAAKTADADADADAE